MRRPDSNYFKRPPGTPKWISDELLMHTVDVWQPFYSRSLQPEDALEMILNVSQLLAPLRNRQYEEVRSPGSCQ